MPGYRPLGQHKYYHIMGLKLVIANYLQRVIHNSCLIVPAYLIICTFLLLLGSNMSVVISSEFGVYRGCTSPEREQRPWNSILLLTNKVSLSFIEVKRFPLSDLIIVLSMLQLKWY